MTVSLMQKIRRIFLVLVALVFSIGAFAETGRADSVVVVLNTGFSGGGLIPQGSQDPNWVYEGATDFSLNPIASGGPAWVVQPNPAWVNFFADAAWIGPTSDSGTTNMPPGLYTYSFTFNLASDLQNLSIALEFGTDDLFDSFTLNGIEIHPPATVGNGFKTNPSNPNTLPFTVSSSNQSLFNVGGQNVLQITVHNKLFNDNPTPTGFILRGAITASSVPEPTSGLLLLSGFLTAGVYLRFRS